MEKQTSLACDPMPAKTHKKRIRWSAHPEFQLELFKTVQSYKLHLLPPRSKDLQTKWTSLANSLNKNELFQGHQLDGKCYREAFEKCFERNCSTINSSTDFYLEKDENPWHEVLILCREMQQESQEHFDREKSEQKEKSEKKKIDLARTADEILSQEAYGTLQRTSKSNLFSHSESPQILNHTYVPSPLPSSPNSPIPVDSASSDPLCPSHQDIISSEETDLPAEPSKKRKNPQNSPDQIFLDQMVKRQATLDLKHQQEMDLRQQEMNLRREEMNARREELNLFKEMMLALIHKNQ